VTNVVQYKLSFCHFLYISQNYTAELSEIVQWNEYKLRQQIF